MKQGQSKEWLSLPAETRQLILPRHAVSPVPVGAIATDLGLVVKRSTLPAGISGEIRPDVTEALAGFVIRVDRHELKERQRFTVAHEISHFLLHKELIKDGLSDDVLYRSSLSNRREAEANRLAADLIMPWSLILKWMEQFPDSAISMHVDALADYLQVSKVAIQIRLGNGG